MSTMQRVLLGIFLVLISVLALFWYQNAQRFPMLDVNGHYLSFDLLFFGGVIAQPISVATLMLISFALGIVFAFIAQALLKMSAKSDEYSDF